MKKTMTLFLALVLALGTLTACGKKADAEAADVDLTAFYTELEKKYEWNEGYMVDLEGEMLESYYPGISDIPTKQFLAKAPMMSFVVNELVLMQCETEQDADAAAAILQDRVDTQAEGGAWYPESMEAWGKAQVIRQETYVAMIASASYQQEMADAFNALFA